MTSSLLSYFFICSFSSNSNSSSITTQRCWYYIDTDPDRIFFTYKFLGATSIYRYWKTDIDIRYFSYIRFYFHQHQCKMIYWKVLPFQDNLFLSKIHYIGSPARKIAFHIRNGCANVISSLLLEKLEEQKVRGNRSPAVDDAPRGGKEATSLLRDRPDNMFLKYMSNLNEIFLTLRWATRFLGTYSIFKLKLFLDGPLKIY